MQAGNKQGDPLQHVAVGDELDGAGAGSQTSRVGGTSGSGKGIILNVGQHEYS